MKAIRSAGLWLSELSPLVFVLFWAAIAFAFIYVGYRWIDPLPPRQLSIAAGATGSTYDNYARQYARILARNGVQLNVRNTAGALENLHLLRDPASGVQAALTTFGLGEPDDPEILIRLVGYSLARYSFFTGTFSRLRNFPDSVASALQLACPEPRCASS